MLFNINSNNKKQIHLTVLSLDNTRNHGHDVK